MDARFSIAVIGDGHLAETTCRAARARHIHVQWGWSEVWPGGASLISDLVFVADDILDHADTAALDRLRAQFTRAVEVSRGSRPVVVLSQVPPGTMRAWVDALPDGLRRGRSNIFYMIDTIIVAHAIGRMVRPEQVVVGCYDDTEDLPLVLQEYFVGLQCPVKKMSYESAELAKCMINVALARQIEVACHGARAASEVGADWADVADVLRGDARIGAHAYLRPGSLNQHLRRDVRTIDALVGKYFAVAAGEGEKLDG